MRAKALVVMCSVLAVLGMSSTASAATTSATAQASGGAEFVDPDTFRPIVPGTQAEIVDGVGYAPADAPLAVQQVIWAGNRIVGMPYRYGGGHRLGFDDTGYDCSGTVSFALHGADLLDAPLDSRRFRRWGQKGAGSWITVFTNRGHAYLHVAGIRLDTSAAEDRGGLKGARWRPLRKSNRGYRQRHPLGL